MVTARNALWEMEYSRADDETDYTHVFPVEAHFRIAKHTSPRRIANDKKKKKKKKGYILIRCCNHKKNNILF